MKKSILLLALVFLTGCSQMTKIPNINEKQDMTQSSESDLLDSKLIYQGVTVGGVDVSGTNLESCQDLLKKELGGALSKEVKLENGDLSYSYPLETYGYDLDYEAMATQALKIGREGNEEARLAKIKDLKENPVDLDVKYVLDETQLDGLIKELGDDLVIEPVEAEYSYDADQEKIVASNGRDGRKLDSAKLKEAVIEAVDQGQDRVELPIENIMVAEDAQAKANSVDGIIGSSDSYFNTGFWERCENIRVSTNFLNNTVLAPGETFSFNDAQGDTTGDKGYQVAVIIDENNEQVPGWGGGVCQTTTGLYQAVLRSDLQIINRAPHTQFMSYSEGGLDAAVEYGSADLAFRNNFDFPILVKSYYEPGHIHFDIYGDTSVKDYDVAIFSEENPVSAGRSFSAYRRNEATGEVEYLGDTFYPPLNQQ